MGVMTPPEAHETSDEALARLGAMVRAERESVGLTQVALAKRVGVSPGTINRIEKGRRKPSLKLRAKIARVVADELTAASAAA
jgi:DNA-binding XRE family transcriptional regulator